MEILRFKKKRNRSNFSIPSLLIKYYYNNIKVKIMANRPDINI